MLTLRLPFLPLLLAGFVLLASSASASSVLITSDPHTGTTTTFTGTTRYDGAGPTTANGFIVTGNPNVTTGVSTYGLGSNGTWNWSYVSTNTSSGSITFNLNGAYDFVGALLNYCPNCGGSDPIITALGLDGTTVIGTYDLATFAPISTSGTNAGAFRGISSTSDNIGFLHISGDYILAHTLEVQAAPVAVTPEPSSLLLLGTGLLGAIGVLRKRLA